MPEENRRAQDSDQEAAGVGRAIEHLAKNVLWVRIRTQSTGAFTVVYDNGSVKVNNTAPTLYQSLLWLCTKLALDKETSEIGRDALGMLKGDQ